MSIITWIVLFWVALIVLSYNRASLVVWSVASGILFILFSFFSPIHGTLLIIWWLIFLIIFIPLNIFPLRRWLISRHVLRVFQKYMPKMSETEKEALTAGGVGWSADLFSGMPDWEKLRKTPVAYVSKEEQAFLDGPVEILCSMIDNWTISRTMTIPREIWNFLKQEGFFGMIIPKKYGGKEFSNSAHSQVIVKVAGVSVAVGTVVSVPNSLGPAELLLHYGTEEQKDYYLPRLARGEEIPCFALTSPLAGSDASSITDYGIVCEHEYEGKKQLCVRLNWNKRYITLAPVATILGLAFKLYDPDHLLGNKEALGITCALIPTNVAGVIIGRRHYPLDSAFPNGPTQGKDVIVPIDWIIGGAKMAGHGWRMLMESLAAGRGISLPSMMTGGAKRNALLAGAYARIRRQFNTYIGNFGGIQDVLARIGANAYSIEAIRRFTVSALDQKQKPVVASAISKYHTTELGRMISQDMMDIHAGKGICMGPNNYIAQSHIEIPISITVEGANILTRCMIIFGQGSIRCHPFILPEITAAQCLDSKHGLINFDRALFGHIGFLLSNMVRAFILGITNAYFVIVPKGVMKRYYQLFTRYSAILAFAADLCILTIGAALKRREKISARLGDMLSFLYIGSAVLKFYESGSRGKENPEERPVVEWICRNLLCQLQTQLDGLLHNLPNRYVRWILHIIVLPLGKLCVPPSDHLGSKIAKLLLEPSGLRKRFVEHIYFSPNENNPVIKIERVLKAVIACEPLEKKIHQAKHDGVIEGKNLQELVDAALAAEVISEEEAKQILTTHRLCMNVINVDDFPSEYFQ